MDRWNITAPLGCSFRDGKEIVEMNGQLPPIKISGLR
jgi:hypothetical protein